MPVKAYNDLSSRERGRLACSTRQHCISCRTNPDWLESQTGARDFICPWGITELTISPPAPGQTGDIFRVLLQEKYKITFCDACRQLMDRMNLWGAEGCSKNQSEILEDIWSRKSKVNGWRNMAARLPLAKHLAFAELKKLLKEAIDKTT